MSLLQAIELKKTFGTREKTVEAVKGVSFSVHQGEILAFLGLNGAGKTTTIKMLLNLILPDSGRVLVRGKEVGVERRALQDMGAVLEGNRNLYWRLTPMENLVYFGTLRGMSRADVRSRARELLELFELKDKAHSLTQKLSRGMQQKLAIAVSIIHRPRLLLLDEPTLGLDVAAAEQVKLYLSELVGMGHSILLTTHQLDVAEAISHRVAIIHKGEILVEEDSSSLLTRFKGNTYQIQLEEAPAAETASQLALWNASIEEKVITVNGTAEQLYGVLGLLKPMEIIKVQRNDLDLTSVFLKLVEGGKVATASE